jgi:hypothetical protein
MQGPAILASLSGVGLRLDAPEAAVTHIAISF